MFARWHSIHIETVFIFYLALWFAISYSLIADCVFSRDEKRTNNSYSEQDAFSCQKKPCFFAHLFDNYGAIWRAATTKNWNWFVLYWKSDSSSKVMNGNTHTQKKTIYATFMVILHFILFMSLKWNHISIGFSINKNTFFLVGCGCLLCLWNIISSRKNLIFREEKPLLFFLVCSIFQWISIDSVPSRNEQTTASTAVAAIEDVQHYAIREFSYLSSYFYYLSGVCKEENCTEKALKSN